MSERITRILIETRIPTERAEEPKQDAFNKRNYYQGFGHEANRKKSKKKFPAVKEQQE